MLQVHLFLPEQLPNHLYLLDQYSKLLVPSKRIVQVRRVQYGDTVLDELPQDQVSDWCGYKHHTDVESYGIENQYSY